MRCHVTAFVVSMLLCGTLGASRASADEAADAVCPRLLSAAAIAADLGSGFALQNLSDSDGIWHCSWQTDSQPPRRLLVRYNHEGAARAQALFDGHVANMKKAGIALETVADLGQQGTIATLGDAFIISLRTTGAYISMNVMGGGTREQALAIARRVAAVTPQSIAEARTALARVRANPAPVPELEEVVVRRDGKPLPCEQLLPRAEVVAVLGDSYKLTRADDPRPGMSICEWKRPTDSYEMTVRVHSEPEFKDSKMAGPVEFFNFETKMGPCASAESLPNLGQQARICSSGDRSHTVIIRRARDVVVFSCPDCTRNDAVALGRAAAQ